MPESLKGDSAIDKPKICLVSVRQNLSTDIGTCTLASYLKKEKEKRSAMVTARKKCQTLDWLGCTLMYVHSWAWSRDRAVLSPGQT